MKLLLFLLFALSSTATPQDVEETIRRSVLAFNDAYEKNALDEYFGFYADDATLWFSSGRVKLEDYRKDWYALKEGGGGVEENEVSDLRIQVGPSGDTAVATYVLDVVTRYPDGRKVKEKAWETDVWFRRDGEWKIAHIHYASHEVP